MKGLILLCVAIVALSESAYGIRNVTKNVNAKVYAHIMPWFETPQSDGHWGQHWTMANQNPDAIVGEDGKRQIASHYYPENHPYASGDYNTVEYQLLLMKYSGIDGVLIDWPGTTQAWDYPKNKQVDISTDENIFSPFGGNKPTFLTLWYQNHQAPPCRGKLSGSKIVQLDSCT